MSESKSKKNWLVGFWGGLGCVIAGDAASICCQIYEIEGIAATISWLVPLIGFIYFFFFKFWRNTEAIDTDLAGRMRRKTYFVSILIWGIIVLLLSALIEFGVGEAMKGDEGEFGWLVQLASSITTLIVFRYIVRRLHDIGWTCKIAKWQLMIAMLSMTGFMFPTLAAIVIVVGDIPNFVLGLIVLFHGGSAGENAYGANPRIK